MSSGRRERGSQAVELTVLAPVLLLLIGALVIGARIAIAGNALESAAAAAAREATLADSGETARQRAERAAREWMEYAGYPCDALSASVTQRGPGDGAPATVHITLSCSLAMGDIALPGLERARQLESSATSPIDSYRESP